MATLRLPGLRPVDLFLGVLLFWLLIAFNVIWKQHSVAGAFTLFLEQVRMTGKEEIDMRSIVDAVRQRGGDLLRATLAGLTGFVRQLRQFKLGGIKHWTDSLL